MNDWLAVSDLIGLPGIPTTPSGLIRWLTKNNIASRNVPGRGGPNGTKRVYCPDNLPEQTRIAIAQRRAGNRTPIAPLDVDAAKAGAVEGAKLDLQESLSHRAAMNGRIDSLKSAASLPDKSQARMDAKLELLRAREIFQRTAGVSVKASYQLFAVAYNERKIVVADWIRGHVPTLSGDTLRNWRRKVKHVGITALAGNYGNRKGTGRIDSTPALRDFIIGLVVRTPHARATHVMEGIRARFGRTEVAAPSMTQLKSWLREWRNDNAQTLAALSNPDHWKNKYMVAFGSASEGIVRLNQRWELDSTPGDVMLRDGRHQVIGMIDVYSRRAKLLVSKTSKAVAVSQLLRGALLEFGVPESVKTDNGQEYVSKHVTRVLRSLDIAHELCAPFQPWLKPFIERFFGTMSRGLMELLPNFIGHNVAERQAIEARQSFAERLTTRGQTVEIDMTAADFQHFLNRWHDEVYMRNAHRELGRSPFDVVCAWPHALKRIDDERALDVLLAPVAGDDGWRVVRKRGLEIDGAWFIAPELEAYVGERVLCLELQDLGRVVVQGGAAMQFIAIAECPERTGISRKEVAAHASEKQKARVQADRRALRALSGKQRVDDLVEEILVKRGEENGTVVTLPRAADLHTSAGLDAAAGAVRELHRAPRSTAELMSDDHARSERARIEQLVPTGNDNELARRRQEETAPVFENRFERVIWTLQRAKVRALTSDEQETLAAYKRDQPASYRQLTEMVDEQFASAGKDAPGQTGAA